jgi:outer membrane lipoprotein-sorting protein
MLSLKTIIKHRIRANRRNRANEPAPWGLLGAVLLATLFSSQPCVAQDKPATRNETLGAQAVKPAPMAASRESQDSILTQVQAHLRSLKTMRARFTQRAGDGRVSTGAMVFARPGGIRFDYQGNIPYLVVSDGKTLNLVDYEIRQVQSYPVGETPLAILLDPKLELRTRARVVEANDKTGDPERFSIEAQDSKHPEYGLIQLGFVRDAGAPAGLRLTGWQVVDAQGVRTQIALSALEYNIPVRADTFRFKDPRPAQSGIPGRR